MRHCAPDEFNRHLDRWKRLRRQGWSVTVLFEYGATERVLAFGCLEDGAEPVPDRHGRTELPLDV